MGEPGASYWRAGQGRAGQGRAGQGRAGQGRAGQGRAGQWVGRDWREEGLGWRSRDCERVGGKEAPLWMWGRGIYASGTVDSTRGMVGLLG